MCSHQFVSSLIGRKPWLKYCMRVIHMHSAIMCKTLQQLHRQLLSECTTLYNLRGNSSRPVNWQAALRKKLKLLESQYVWHFVTLCSSLCLLHSPPRHPWLSHSSGVAGASAWNKAMRAQGLSTATGQTGPHGLPAPEVVRAESPIETDSVIIPGMEKHTRVKVCVSGHETLELIDWTKLRPITWVDLV